MPQLLLRTEETKRRLRWSLDPPRGGSPWLGKESCPSASGSHEHSSRIKEVGLRREAAAEVLELLRGEVLRHRKKFSGLAMLENPLHPLRLALGLCLQGGGGRE